MQNADFQAPLCAAQLELIAKPGDAFVISAPVPFNPSPNG